MRHKMVFLSSRKFPERGYITHVEGGGEPEGYLEYVGQGFQKKEGWPPLDDPGPHEVFRSVEWDGEAPEETYEVTWRLGWGSCD